MSIPDANDAATARFVTLYHGFRADGVSPMAALQRTQLQMLRDDEFKPFMWIDLPSYGCH